MSEPSFRALGVSQPVVDALAKRGVTAPFPIQALVIEDVRSGQDVLAKSPTGSGKTLAFAIPIVDTLAAAEAHRTSAPAALVLVPTRELAVQVADEFQPIAKVRGLRVAAVYGGVPFRSQIKAARDAHILVATPGRLTDLVTQRAVSLAEVRILVLDEADRMLDMGFKPQVDRIVTKLPTERQTMFFSATLDGQVGVMARSYTTDPCRHEFGAERPTIEQVDHRFVSVTHETKLDTLAEMLDGTATLVFVRTRRGASRLADKLEKRGLNVVSMHGDMTQSARQQALRRFEQGKAHTLVATDVAARGIDLDHIEQVINFDPPEDNKAYVHRVGRTGRAGRSGVGVTFVTRDQQADVSRIATRLDLHSEFAQEGRTIAPPKLVYKSKRRRGGRGW